MIEAVIFKNGYTVKGHAGHAEIGKDIVCSAISALAQTTLMGLDEYSNIAFINSPGMMVVNFKPPTEITNALMHTFLIGLKHIQKDYPHFVQLKEVND